MFRSLSSLALLALAPGAALAHPGHGKPGFLHSHTWAQLADWLAGGVLIVFSLVAAGAVCWMLFSAFRRARK